MANASTAGKWFLGLGIASAVVGIVCIATSRSRSQAMGSLLPDKVGETRRGGMTVKHYKDKRMDVKQRIGLIQDLVWKGVQDPQMRKLALQITNKCEARDDLCEARAIYDYTRANLRYAGDIAPVKQGRDGALEAIDFYTTAKRSLEMGGEDCDGHTIVNATLLSLNGIEAGLRVTGNDPRTSVEDWGHIYAVAKLPKNDPTREVPLDTTVPRPFFGMEAPYGKKVDFPA